MLNSINKLFKSVPKANKILGIVYLLFIALSPSYSQSSFEEALKTIEANNKTLKANDQLWASRLYEYRTGLYLKNPSASLDYMWGNRPELGNRYEINVVQQFDFPTAYASRNKISDLRINQIDPQKRIIRQQVILEVYLKLIDIVYYNKLADISEKRSNYYDSVVANLEKAVDKGEKGILDLNRAKLEGIKIKSRLIEITRNKMLTLQILKELNGGNEITSFPGSYPDIRVEDNFEVYFSNVSTNHPIIKSLESEIEISKARINLNKSLSLPGFEIGYRRDNEKEISYNGVHVGISIPLFENRYRVAAAESELLYSELNLELSKLTIRSDLEKSYARYLSLTEQIEQINSIVRTTNQHELIAKAFQLGQISFFEFVLEMNSLYETELMLTEYEKELAQIKARLLIEGFRN